ncbi:MAG: S-methyl-5-thioribose-1-phosphate isomerase [Desulfobulbaceae bacterium]|jgi:S-methyl-5-thioribose-1-phosphate isomerase|nr:S-methyl-5-thioribose-1-phosphate isomerase [Desulfobulbaceae bacterium]
MHVNGQHYRTVWLQSGVVMMIEQNKLPFSFQIHQCHTYHQTCQAITTMVTRGAGAIGSTAAYAMAQAFLAKADANQARATIEATRPTARNLFYAVKLVFAAGMAGGAARAVAEAERIADEDCAACRAIGEFGAALMPENCRLATHCNAGWLAFTDYGSALAPVYAAARLGKKPFVYVDETRPRGQGARLTAWELRGEGIDHAIIADNACAWLMAQGKIDLMIVGADRIARNGDTANKIGTLEKALAARHFGVPFYVAAPTATIDLACQNGRAIPIEEREPDEILYQTGPDKDGVMREILVCSPGSEAVNPAFDVTPVALVSGFITEKGILQASEIGL